MKKLFAITLFILTPLSIFSQGINKTNLGITGGISIPVGTKEFEEIYKPGWDLSLNAEHTINKLIALGGEISLNNYTTKLDYGIGQELHPVSIPLVSIDGFMKLQNNLADKGSFQYFIKAGAGYYSSFKKKSYYENTNKIGNEGIIVLTGGGLNYILNGETKITSAIEYRTNFSSQPVVSFVQLKTGLSFSLK